MYALKVLAAAVGGLVGLALIFHNKPITRHRIFSESLATVIFAWGATDVLLNEYPFGVCLFGGLLVGFLNGYFLDMLKAIAPRLTRFGFRAWVAKMLDLKLPDSVFDEKLPEHQDTVLDENRDREAVAWLDENPKYTPPKPLNQFKRNNIEKGKTDE